MPKASRGPRGLQACHECRRRKVRCNDSRPRCDNCASHDRQCQWPDRPAPGGYTSVFRRESPASAMISPTSPVTSHSPPIAGSSKNLSEPARTVAHLPSVPLKRRLVDIFAQRHHKFELCGCVSLDVLLSEVPGRDDMFVLYSVLALASVYLTEEEASTDRKFTSSGGMLQFYATEAAAASRQCSDQPSVAAIQGNLILGLSELITMATARAWMHVGLAIRMAQALRMRNEYNQRRTPRQREVRRRTFWACALLDRLVAYCTFRTQTISLTLVGLHLPCDEVAFAFGRDDPGPRFNDLGETDAGNIPLAYLIKTFMLWARVARLYVDGGRHRLGAAPCDPATKCWQNVFDVRTWINGLPNNMKWSEENLRAHQALGQAAPYISVHFLAQHALFLVHQEHLPQADTFRGPERQETPGLPSSITTLLTDVDRTIIRACIDGANNIVQMCQLLDITIPDSGQQFPVFCIGIPLVTASSVLLWIHYHSQKVAPDLGLTDIQVSQAKSDVDYLLSKLSVWSKQWALAKTWVGCIKLLDEFYRLDHFRQTQNSTGDTTLLEDSEEDTEQTSALETRASSPVRLRDGAGFPDITMLPHAIYYRVRMITGLLSEQPDLCRKLLRKLERKPTRKTQQPQELGNLDLDAAWLHDLDLMTSASWTDFMSEFEQTDDSQSHY
ncbi:transcription factor [Dactylonectria estremocensis]|uniref:Transcription factor n=1 Tax=Dactylonectria estremocensis TaxID=1079267 RepID=A0A9P9EGP0_9HYPO|nr:transcription factor [Dactylonectria estremocensis]